MATVDVRVQGAQHRLTLIAWAVVIVGAIITDVVAGNAARAGLVAAVGLLSAVTMAYWIARYRPAYAFGWWAIAAAVALFAAGFAFRGEPFRTPGHGFTVALALTTLGNIAMVAGGVRVALGRRLRPNPAFIDLFVIVVGAFLAEWVLLIVPTARPGVSGLDAALSGLCPAADIIMLTLLAQLSGSINWRNNTPRLSVAALGMVTVGDVVGSIAHSFEASPPTAFMAAAYLLAFGLAAVAVASPGITTCHAPAPAPAPGATGLVLIAVMLLVCALVPTLTHPHSPTDLVVRSMLVGLILMGLFVRGERAIRHLRVQAQEARYAATHDVATGLPNRLVLQQSPPGFESGPVTVLFIDLDNFNDINDSYGHQIGDLVIAETAHRITDVLRPDDLAVHYNGDEFVVLTHGIRVRPEALAQRILAAIEVPFRTHGLTLQVTASAGITLAEADGTPTWIDEAVHDADTAMRRAKSRGSGLHSLFDTSLRARVLDEAVLTLGLRGAVDRGEFDVYYQPIVNAHTREVVDREALLRWTYQGQTVPPDIFIPLAERSDIIAEIGEFVLQRSLSDAACWRASEPNVGVAVNISARQLRGDTLVHQVELLLSTHRFPPQALTIELTETAVLDTLSEAAEQLQRLADLGVNIAMDDFGTGLSSLTRLRTLPITTVKIDKSFVADLGTSQPVESMVAAIIALSEALGLGTVAEGVQTIRQAAILERLGCGRLQGYLYGRPKPGVDLLPTFQAPAL
ncbi:putative bifunctional diguanylate cyclase/phosphodiesterase [Williamsia sterculiae]|uniref:Diguanylate cyclase (GGDEF) domain-containing protein n=1 Tax=Williamsia sterculiae TaxID=1344003 RepID=A0A1N7HBL8_9NOCA|nr:GGDEF domain-containing phosphodiesterase [Williamsia sterculiae]SIS22078.1 diguanylate cyclase (GGDEF) domain-containing protein [Williamsia sterculiae]